jgi:hypothetical protein
LLVSFSFLLFSLSLFLLLCCFCSGPMRTHPTTLPRLLAPTAYHRGGHAPFGRFDILCTSRNLSLLFLLLFRSSSPCRTACDLLVPVVVVEALRVTLTRHMMPRDMRIRALKIRQRTSIPLALFIHSACQLPKERLRDMTTRCCSVSSQK